MFSDGDSQALCGSCFVFFGVFVEPLPGVDDPVFDALGEVSVEVFVVDPCADGLDVCASDEESGFVSGEYVDEDDACPCDLPSLSEGGSVDEVEEASVDDASCGFEFADDLGVFFSEFEDDAVIEDEVFVDTGFLSELCVCFLEAVVPVYGDEEFGGDHLHHESQVFLEAVS